MVAHSEPGSQRGLCLLKHVFPILLLHAYGNIWFLFCWVFGRGQLCMSVMRELFDVNWCCMNKVELNWINHGVLHVLCLILLHNWSVFFGNFSQSTGLKTLLLDFVLLLESLVHHICNIASKSEMLPKKAHAGRCKGPYNRPNLLFWDKIISTCY